ncbi:hypothetical protein GCM10025786_19430 [Nocardioides caeni]
MVTRWPARLPVRPGQTGLRADVLLGWLVAAHVVMKVLIYPLVLNAEPFGDEAAYLDGGMAMSNLLRDVVAFTAPDTTELELNVVGSAWFMPGMPVLLAPLYLLFPDAPIWLVRGYLGLVTLMLFLAVVRSVRRRLGARWACVVVVLPGLVPSWVVFTYGAWGDLCAGLVLVLLLLRLVDLVRGLRAGEAPSLRAGLVLGLQAIAVLYLRSSTSALLAGLGAATLVAASVMLRGRVRWRGLAAAALAGATFAALLAPWSIFASRTLDARVLTTTTVPTVLANTFGDPDELCFGRCDPGSTMWFAPLRYAREVGRATDTSEVEVLQVMSDHAMRDVGPERYFDGVAHNLAAYTLQPTNFNGYLAPPEGRGLVGTVGQLVADVLTWVLYVPLMLIGLVSLLFHARRSVEARILDIVTKLAIGGLLLQLFVHLAGGRYWATAAIPLGIAAVSFLRERQLAGSDGPPPPPDDVGPSDEVLVRWLGRVQGLLRAATTGVVVVLAVAVVL